MERPIEPQTTTPTTSFGSPKKRLGTKLKIAIALICVVGIIAMGLIGSYVIASSNIADSASKFESSTQNLQITNLSVNPPSVDMKEEVIVTNPTNVDFVVNKYKADLYIKYGSEVYSVGTIDVSDKTLPANGYVTIPLTIHCGSEVINFLSSHTSGYNMVVSGSISVSGKYSFWTVTNDRSINIEQSIESLNQGQNLSPIPTETPSYTDSPTYTFAPTPTPNTAVGFSRSNPAPMGTTVDLQFQYLYKTYYAQITVTQVVRGSQAWSMLQEANMFNDPPAEGFEYVVAKIRFEYYQGPTSDTQFSVSPVNFKAISSSGVTYDSSFAVDPDPSLTTSLYPGASHEGWATYQVALSDSNPLLAFAREYDGTGGVWFSLSQATTGSS